MYISTCSRTARPNWSAAARGDHYVQAEMPEHYSCTSLAVLLILMLAFSFLQLGHYCQLTACVMSPCSCSSFHFLTIILSVAGSFTASFFLSLSSSPIAISDSNCPQVALFFPVSLSVDQVPSWCLYLWLEEREELSDTSSIVQVFLYDIKYPV